LLDFWFCLDLLGFIWSTHICFVESFARSGFVSCVEYLPVILCVIVST